MSVLDMENTSETQTNAPVASPIQSTDDRWSDQTILLRIYHGRQLPNGWSPVISPPPPNYYAFGRGWNAVEDGVLGGGGAELTVCFCVVNPKVVIIRHIFFGLFFRRQNKS